MFSDLGGPVCFGPWWSSVFLDLSGPVHFLDLGGQLYFGPRWSIMFLQYLT